MKKKIILKDLVELFMSGDNVKIQFDKVMKQDEKSEDVLNLEKEIGVNIQCVMEVSIIEGLELEEAKYHEDFLKYAAHSYVKSVYVFPDHIVFNCLIEEGYV